MPPPYVRRKTVWIRRGEFTSTPCEGGGSGSGATSLSGY
jgi:hypothetical protein